jgi:hypothetical protein
VGGINMAFDISQLVAEWDREYEANLSQSDPPEKRQPYGKTLTSLNRISDLRFQRYENDDIPTFLEKLRAWLTQFDDQEKKVAFLLANRIIFVTESQFAALQRRLFSSCIRRHLLDYIIKQHRLKTYDYTGASGFLDKEMDATIFVANSDSSQLNSFVHLNGRYFFNRQARRLVGPEVRFWTYPSERARRASGDVRLAAQTFELEVLSTDPLLKGKRRMVIVEDFSGSGADLVKTLFLLDGTSLPFTEVVIAPAIATSRAIRNLHRICARLNKRTYSVIPAETLPENLSCFDGLGPAYKSYLDGEEPIKSLSLEVKVLSTNVYNAHFQSGSSPLQFEHRYGVGNLSLAFAMYKNCPDNCLPVIWKKTDTWSKPLFPRVSRII